MENKKIMNVLIGVLLSTFFFYLFASGGSLLAGNLLFPSKDFGENTYIGPYDVSDYKEAETTKVLNEGVTDLQSRFDVEIRYLDGSFKLPQEAVEYDVSGTINEADSGQENPLLVRVKDGAIRTLLEQNLGELDLTDEEINAISDGIERRLRIGTMPANVQISDFLDAGRKAGETVSASAMFDGQPMTEGLINGLGALNGVEIAGGSTVSFLQLMESLETGSLTKDEMTRIASLLYAAVLNTNFVIDERSISNRLPDGIPLGFEAAVDPATGTDLMFTNPTGATFTLATEVNGDTATLTLLGLPFLYEYSTSVTGTESFEPRLIKQFSENVTTVAPRIEEQGEDGIRATVLKTVTDESIEMSMEEISTDFYPPVHRIEVHRLKPEEQPEENADNGADGNTSGGTSSDGNTNNSGNSNGSGNSGSSNGSGTNNGNSSGSGNAGSSGNNSGGSGNSGKTGSGNNSDQGNGSSSGGNSGTGNNDGNGSSDGSGGNKDDIQYDKGGNPIKP
ncbi:VanW family protein [Bhargavaea ginsengi]|uniref:VanW family protein n=1 Tax=Bhargavaea ginsengi TaxID=426757 RepID=UPI00203E5132|nr:VanW family protein [Bhargavaea ginsengi]MCM3086599.1 VanW family protein [Bhargavaea ginsengi]